MASLRYLACVSLTIFINSYASEASARGSVNIQDETRKTRLHSPSLGPEDHILQLGEEKAKALCLECEVLIEALKVEIDLGITYEQFLIEGLEICTNVMNMSQTTCEGHVELKGPVAWHILQNNPIIPSDMCGILMSEYGCNTTQPDRDWSINIHDGKPPIQPIPLPEPGQPTMKVLQISDTHMDPLYLPGSNADCGEEFCCREESGVPLSSEAEAWYWGDYRHCGSTPWMLEDMLKNIREMHPDLSYVMWTGDVVPHNMWSTSREWNTRVIKETGEMIQQYFPDIPVFPVIGNHEESPLDFFPDPDNCPEELCADWLYESLAAQWERVLPGLNISTVLYAGYYSVPLAPGFRIISINSIFGYTHDWWLYQNSHDVGHGLQWLEGELWKAEQAGELVHLLGHIPPGYIIMERTWSREYNRIINRYENIIRGQFFGHTHFDEFEIFKDGDRPIGVGYICPSQTTWFDLNPAYRIYTVDGQREDSTWMILDHSTYIMNLTASSETNVTRWFELYSAKEAYQMPSLSPQDWHQFALDMTQDENLFNKYWRHYVSEGDPFLATGCDDLCHQQRLCDIMISDRNDLDACYSAIELYLKAN